MMIDKPPHGSPCNNCGKCCVDQLCVLGNRVFGRWDGPCPALESDGDRYVCGLIRHPEMHKPVDTFMNGKEAMSQAAAFLIGAGRGCDAQINGEPYNEEFGRRLRARRAASKRTIKTAASMWRVVI